MIRNRNRIIVSVLIMLLVFSSVVSFAEQTASSGGYGTETAEEKEIIELDFEVTDAVMDPDKPVLYATDKENMELISFNYETREKKVAKFVYDQDSVSGGVYAKDSTTVGEFVYRPSRIDFADGELYVSLASEDYDYWDDDKTGVIVIVNSDTFAIRNQVGADFEPYDIEIDEDGYFYVTGSKDGSSDYITSYDKSSMKKIDKTDIYKASVIELEKNTNMIHSKHDKYKVDNGMLNWINRSENDYDYENGSKFSPDGKYLFHRYGKILNHCDNGYDNFIEIYKMDDRFDQIVFDIDNNRYFTHDEEEEINVYDYERFKRIGTIESKFRLKKMFLKNKNLVCITKSYYGKYYLEIYNENDMDKYVEELEDYEVAFDGSIADVLYDDVRDRAYMLNWSIKELYIIDTKANKIEEEIKLEYRPASLCFSEDKKSIYIANDDVDYLITEFDLEKKEAKRHLKHKIKGEYRHEGVHKHIYLSNDKLFVVLKDWDPDLLIFDKDSFEQIDYGEMIDGVGDLAVTKDGDELYYSYQLGWGAGSADGYITRCRIDGDHVVPIERTDPGDYEIQRDPVDAPMIMLEDKGLLISKDDIFDMNDIKNRVAEFDEPIYAVDSEHRIAIGKNSIYSLEELKKIGEMEGKVEESYYDKHRNLFISQDGMLYTLSNKSRRIYLTKVPVIMKFEIPCVQIQIGSKYKSDVKVWDAKEVNSNIIWTSSDENVASVTPEGVVTGISEGTTIIRATSEDDESDYAEYKIIVPKEIANIKLDKLNMQIKQGEQSKLNANVTLENTLNDKVVWSTSDEKIASVAQDGTVTGVAGGTALIRATSQIDESYYAECVVNVISKPVVKIAFEKSEANIKKGAKEKLVAKVTLENTTNDKLVWSTSDENIVKVAQDGTITAVAKGTAKVRATSQLDAEYYAECVVNVSEEKSGGSSGGGSGGSGGGGGSSSSDDSATSRARIDIVKDEKGKTVKEIVLKDEEVLKAIDSKKESIVIEDDSSKASDDAKIEISAKIMKKLNDAEKTLEIKSGDVSFKIEPKSFESGKKEVKLNVSRLSSDKKMKAEDGLNMVSDSIFDFELEIGDKNYKDDFDKALTVTMPFDKKKTINDKKLGVYYLDEKENRWEYAGGKISGNGEITFKAQHFSKYAAMECDKTFKDIQGHWAKDSIEIMVSRQIVNGTSEQEFSPDKNITRAEFVALLSRALDMPKADATKKFNDVEGKWYADAVNSAYKAGIVNGMNGGMFAPDKSITREEMATMIMKAYSYAKDENIEDMLSTKEFAFGDENECSAWAKKNIELANEKGLMNGYSQDKTFRPKNNTTRAEAVVVLKNLLSKTDDL